MAVRTKPEQVQAILKGNWDGETDLGPFIEAANGLVDWIDDVCDTDGLMSTKALRKLEAYLAAHFYHCADPMYSSKSAGGASGSFQGQTGMYFDNTFYGQTALLIDLSGCLAQRQADVKSGGRGRVTARWLGSRKRDVNTRIDEGPGT